MTTLLAQTPSNDMNLPAPTPAPRAEVKAPKPTPKPTPQSFAPGSIAGEAIVLAVLVGFATAGIVAAVRKKLVPSATGKLGELLACDLCVSFWTSAVVTSAWWYGSGLPLVKATTLFFGSTWLAGLGVALIAVRAYGRLADPFSAKPSA